MWIAIQKSFGLSKMKKFRGAVNINSITVVLNHGASINFQVERVLTDSSTWDAFECEVFRPIYIIKIRRGLKQQRITTTLAVCVRIHGN